MSTLLKRFRGSSLSKIGRETILNNKVSKIITLLEREYGTPEFDSFDDPLDELIVTLLSQNTTWKNCRRAFDNLKRRFKTWDRVRKAKKEEITDAIKCGGLGKVKGGRIKSLLDFLYRRRKSLSLNFLKRMGTGEALEFLSGLKGVGPKTGACVLLFSLKRPVLPVDTHILRVSKRLGLIYSQANLVKAHELLGRIVPENRVLSFHINLIQHGRRICRPRNPKCDECVLKSLGCQARVRLATLRNSKN